MVCIEDHIMSHPEFTIVAAVRSTAGAWPYFVAGGARVQRFPPWIAILVVQSSIQN
jgi:hypothetical protein